MAEQKIRRALISVSDKTGLVDFARALANAGVALVSTGGTSAALKAAGLAVLDVADLTGFPEMLDGRVKTLHPGVHGGLLAIRGNAEHEGAIAAHGIQPIDLLVVNLYPFEETVAKGAGYDDCVENIDIGGPAMIRAAAKNHDGVTVIVETSDYARVLAEMAANSGATTRTFRTAMAAKAYARTAAYDAAISNWFADTLKTEAPEWRAIGGRLGQALRYGENPHQTAAVYISDCSRHGVATARQIQGKELSYNNLNDTDAAFELVSEFSANVPAVAIIKHANPCGVAVGSSLKQAYLSALACDSVSAYGGIVALNQPIDAEAAEDITRIFTEVVIAPDATDAARAIFAGKKNLRLLITGGLADRSAKGLNVRSIAGGFLVQSRDNGNVDAL
ncbi:MAG: bifunctional phosphoribosylaminoimidazolecarboxamide formyltransferase/IMP cyclohydrolase, partial [Hyphomicrobium sp.]